MLHCDTKWSITSNIATVMRVALTLLWIREMLRPPEGAEEGEYMSTPVWGGPESYADDAYPPSLLKHLVKPTMAQFAAQGACIALFSEARATLATNPEGPVLSFSTDGNTVAEIGVAVIDPATPKAGYIRLARGNGDPLLHLRLDSDGHLFSDGL